MELSEEEKKAIKELKHYINITPYWKQQEYTNNEIDNYIKIVLNLIEQRQKEINREKQYSEFYKDLCNKQQIEIEKLKKENGLLLVNNNGYFDLKKYIKNNYISKDKIREKMREIMGYTFTTSEERHCQDYAYDRLKELLEDD